MNQLISIPRGWRKIPWDSEICHRDHALPLRRRVSIHTSRFLSFTLVVIKSTWRSAGAAQPPVRFHSRSLALMIQSGFIPNAHDDLVTDAAYDFYGLRLATCSLDQK